MSHTPLVKWYWNASGMQDSGQLDDRPFFEAADIDPLLTRQATLEEVCNHILRIMKTYHEQEEQPEGVGTPGGLEHMGDVWRLLSKWEQTLALTEAHHDAIQ